MASLASVGMRFFVEGGEIARRTFDQIGDSGRKMWAELASGSRTVPIAARGINAVAMEAKQGVAGLLGEVGAGGRILGAFGIAGIGAAAALGGLVIALHKTNEALNFIDKLGDDAAKLHFSAEALQEWRFAAQEAGLEAQDFDTSLAALQVNVGKFTSGVGDVKVKKAFDALKISPDDIKNLSSWEQVLDLVADRLNDVGSEAERISLSKQIGMKELLPLMEQGSEKVRQFRQEARELGLVISDETVASMGELQRKVEVASQVVDVQLKQAFLNLAPVLVDIIGLVADMVRALNDFLGLFKAVEARSDGLLEKQLAFQQKKEANTGLNAARDLSLGLPLGTTTAAAHAKGEAIRQELNTRDAAADPFEFDPTFAAGGDGSHAKPKAGKKAPADKSEEAIARAESDRLRATLALLEQVISLAPAYEEQGETLDKIAALQRQQAEKERERKDAQVDRQVKDGQLTAKAGEAIKLINAQVEEDEKSLLEKKAARRKLEDTTRVLDHDLDIMKQFAELDSQILQLKAGLELNHRKSFEMLRDDLKANQDIAFRAEKQRLAAEVEAGTKTQQEADDILSRRRQLLDLQVQSFDKDHLSPLDQWLHDVDEQAANLGETLQTLGVESFKNLADSIAQAAVNGENLGDVLKNVLRQLLAQVLSMSIQRAGAGIFETLFKAAGTALTGYVTPDAGLGGFGHEGFHGAGAAGSDMMSGYRYRTAEHDTEIALIGRQGRVFSHDDTIRMLRDAVESAGGASRAGPTIVIDASTTIHAPGAGPREVDVLKSRMDQHERELPGKIVAAVNDGLSRGAVI